MKYSVKGSVTSYENVDIDPYEVYYDLTRHAIISVDRDKFFGAKKITLCYETDRVIVEKSDKNETFISDDFEDIGAWDNIVNLLIGRDEFFNLKPF